MSKIAIIGGTDLCELKNLKISRREHRTTPYGMSSAPLSYGTLHGKHVVFIARHGDTYTIPPHKINYRANIWALKDAGVDKIISISVVGGIRSDMTPGRFVVPDQLIDYTYLREGTFFDGQDQVIHHISFRQPFANELRQILVEAGNELDLDPSDEAVYGVVEGPRLQTIAEINRMEKDGCDILGFTVMPEAALAREVDIDYACLSVVGGRASGRESAAMSADSMTKVYKESTEQIHGLLQKVIHDL